MYLIVTDCLHPQISLKELDIERVKKVLVKGLKITKLIYVYMYYRSQPW